MQTSLPKNERSVVNKLLEKHPFNDNTTIDFHRILNEVRCALITQALADCKNNVAKAATYLCMNRTTLNQYIKDKERLYEENRTNSTDDCRVQTVAWGHRRRAKQRSADKPNAEKRRD